jgi:hypothetical protein
MSLAGLSKKSMKVVEYVKMMQKILSKEGVKENKKENKPEYMQKCMVQFSWIKDTIPGIFNMLVEDLDDPYDFEMNRLIDMLKMKDAIDAKKITSEQASVHIGQKYADEYVTPLVQRIEAEESTSGKQLSEKK